MKTIYQCEICRNNYDNAAEATACENQPVGEKTRGLLLSRHYNNDPAFTALCTGESERRGHYVQHYTYWFRGNAAGDDFDPRNDIVTGTGSGAHCDTDTDCPSFKRALALCILRGWAPSIWRAGAIVPY